MIVEIRILFKKMSSISHTNIFGIQGITTLKLEESIFWLSRFMKHLYMQGLLLTMMTNLEEEVAKVIVFFTNAIPFVLFK
jgi:hypothetical protein